MNAMRPRPRSRLLAIGSFSTSFNPSPPMVNIYNFLPSTTYKLFAIDARQVGPTLFVTVLALSEDWSIEAVLEAAEFFLRPTTRAQVLTAISVKVFATKVEFSILTLAHSFLFLAWKANSSLIA